MQTPQSLSVLCDQFRTDKRRIGVTLVADNEQARRLLAAFALFPMPTWTRPRTRQPADDRELWLWLWEGYEGGPLQPVFLNHIATVAMVSVEVAFRVWPSIMTSRLLFPDGKLSLVAEAFLESNAERAMPTPRPRAPHNTKARASEQEDDEK